MQIIGKTSGGYIIEMTNRELANLTGFYCTSEREYVAPDIGDTVAIGKLYQQLHKMSFHSKELTQTTAQLRMIADNLEPIEPVISAITKEEITENRPACPVDEEQGDSKQPKDKES